MKRYELEQRYQEYGCKDFKLRNLEDLKNIHGYDVEKLTGYDGLPQEQRELFDKTVIKFFNVWGLDNRVRLKPKSINYVYEVNYSMPIDDEFSNDVGMDIYVIKNDGKTVGKRLHRYKFDKNADFRSCEKYGGKNYLRFELDDEWYHFTPNGEWY